ncbi:MAG: AbgT family transporter [Acidiferrobacterales bacterium]|nr:AbgT family transporter [Acidiferrobacterales bacterium]
MSKSDIAERKGFLAWVERTGNALPDPVFLFIYLILAVVVISAISAMFGVSETLSPQILSGMPEAQKARFGIGADGTIMAQSMLSPENIQRIFVQMPKTFTHFHPLGMVLTVMLGAGVAERTGLFGTAMRAAVGNAPKFLLTPLVAFIAMMGNLAADAAYVVLIPLAALIFVAADRNPIAGIAAAFAGVSGGFSANLVMGQLDALLLGITGEAANILVADYPVNIAGNWYFIACMLFIYVPVIWYVTDKVIEPRLGVWHGDETQANAANSGVSKTLSDDEKRGLKHAGIALILVVVAWAAMVFGPGTPLVNEAACPDMKLATGDCSFQARLTPFYQSLIGAFFVLFIATAWVYGRAVGTVKNHRDIVKMMSEAMQDMGYYLVLVFAAAHFVAMFNWSNLGLIFAVKGAAAIEASQLPIYAVLGVMVLFAALLNLFVGSASAKWAFLAPVVVPMLMLSGVSPEMATAAYRVGDGATNIITPLMFYFPLVLTFANRWQKDFGIGSLTATMIPYSIWMLITGLVLTMIWAALGIPLGGGATVEFAMPG